MKRVVPVFAALLLLLSVRVSAETFSDEEIIIRAVASSYPEASLGAKTAICSVIRNRIASDGFGDCAAEVIRAENSGFDAARLCCAVDAKNARITRDACTAAMKGADPTGGALYFEKLPEPSRKDNRVAFEAEMDVSKYTAVIGGFGFW